MSDTKQLDILKTIRKYASEILRFKKEGIAIMTPDPYEDFEATVKHAFDLKDNEVATELWCALSNMRWVDKNGELVSYSWRAAGGLIADIRDEGSYMDWYMCGPAGLVSDRIRTTFEEHGWYPSPYPKTETWDY